MTKHLSAEAVAQYERDGFYFPIRAIPAERRRARSESDVEAAERHFAARGERLRHRPHLLVTALDRLIRNETVLDAVEDHTRAEPALLDFALLHQRRPRPGLRLDGTRIRPTGASAASRW